MSEEYRFPYCWLRELVLDAMEKRVQANALLRRARTLIDAALMDGQAIFTETDAAGWLASWEMSVKRSAGV